MKSMKYSFTLAASMLILSCLPNSATARTNFHIGIGYGAPHYGWHSRYYRWLDRGLYRNSFACAPIHRHWPRHRWSSHMGFWIDDWYSSVIVETPVIFERSKVITTKEIIVKPKYDDETLKLYKRLRTRKSELLKKLRLGDKANRKQAISELAGFSYDNTVRKALEDILLSNPNPELRKEAAKSFAKVRNKKVLPALEKARVQDSDKEVREEADKAIKNISGH